MVGPLDVLVVQDFLQGSYDEHLFGSYVRLHPDVFCSMLGLGYLLKEGGTAAKTLPGMVTSSREGNYCVYVAFKRKVTCQDAYNFVLPVDVYQFDSCLTDESDTLELKQ